MSTSRCTPAEFSKPVEVLPTMHSLARSVGPFVIRLMHALASPAQALEVQRAILTGRPSRGVGSSHIFVAGIHRIALSLDGCVPTLKTIPNGTRVSMFVNRDAAIPESAAVAKVTRAAALGFRRS